MAAQLGYKSPRERMEKAIENTRQMFDIIKGLEHAAANKAKKS